MKNLLSVVLTITLLALVYSCSGGSRPASSDMLLTAEDALGVGKVTMAQQIADTLLAEHHLSALDVGQLCRLSILFVRLSESNTEAGNTANAVRVLGTAFSRDSDSTAAYISNVPYDMRAAVIVAAALTDAYGNPGYLNGNDSLNYCTDSIR